MMDVFITGMLILDAIITYKLFKAMEIYEKTINVIMSSIEIVDDGEKNGNKKQTNTYV